MKLKYKYIYFTKSNKQNPKTVIYNVRTDNKTGLAHYLGEVRWYAQWRQYAFYPAEGTVFEKTCLNDIAEFCIELNERQRLKNFKANLNTKKKVKRKEPFWPF